MKTLSENAIKDRLRNLANEQGKSVNELLKKLYLERFLARLAKSKFTDQLIFKGGYLLRYYIKIGRETKDLDFLFTQLNAEIPVIKKIFQNICSLNIKDGFSIAVLKIELLDHPHMTYPGFRVTLKIKHTEGTLKDNLQIDIAVGDVVNAKALAMSLLKYKSEPFFEDKISLKAYPPEFIFAEKLIAIISKGNINSRMKDFHDLTLMSRNTKLLKANQLKKTINQVFKHKGMEKQFPIKFSKSDYEQFEKRWEQYREKNKLAIKETNLPKKFKKVVSELNIFLSEHIK